jgi:hypothetical protein
MGNSRVAAPGAPFAPRVAGILDQYVSAIERSIVEKLRFYISAETMA